MPLWTHQPAKVLLDVVGLRTAGDVAERWAADDIQIRTVGEFIEAC